MEKKSFLKTENPKASTLNKKAIVIFTAAIIFIMAAAVFMALTPSKHQTDAAKTFDVSQVNSQPLSAIQGLPSSYQDADGIDKILRNKDNTQLSGKLQSEIDALKAQQKALQSQLHANPSTHMPDALTQEAINSQIFFVSGEPQTLSQKEITAAAAAQSQQATNAGLPNGTSNKYAEQNMQTQKLDFLNSKVDKNVYNDNAVQYPVSKYIVQAGTVIPAILETSIVSDLPGTIVAVVDQDVYDSISGKYLLIPKGTKVIGEYNSQISYGQNQVQAKFIRMIRPDGTSVVLPNQSGTSSMGVSGFYDEVNNHWGRVIGSAIMMTMFSVPAIIATNEMNNAGNGQYCTDRDPSCPGGCCAWAYNMPGLGNTVNTSVMQGVGQTMTTIGSNIAEKSLNVQPTITINAGYRFSIMVTKDIVLSPFNAVD